MSFPILGGEKIMEIFWSIWKLKSVWTNTPEVLIFWVKHINVKPLFDSSMGITQDFRGYALNSRWLECPLGFEYLEWYQFESFTKSLHLFASDILVINDDRSFEYLASGNLAINSAWSFCLSASDMEEIIWNKRELTSYMLNLNLLLLFSIEKVAISCLSFRTFWGPHLKAVL